MELKRLNLEEKKTSTRTYTRRCAKTVINNVLKKIKEINDNNEFIYYITKAVIFGSYINSDRERIGDLDIAVYVKLKNQTIPEDEQNWNRSKSSDTPVPFLMRFIYGKEEVFKYIKDKKKVLQLHDGVRAEADARLYNDAYCYIYADKYEIIFEKEK